MKIEFAQPGYDPTSEEAVLKKPSIRGCITLFSAIIGVTGIAFAVLSMNNAKGMTKPGSSASPTVAITSTERGDHPKSATPTETPTNTLTATATATGTLIPSQTPTTTQTPTITSTSTSTPSKTPKPSRTPRPTKDMSSAGDNGGGSSVEGGTSGNGFIYTMQPAGSTSSDAVPIGPGFTFTMQPDQQPTDSYVSLAAPPGDVITPTGTILP